MGNILVMMDLNMAWKLWVFVSIAAIVIIDVSRILYDCVKGEYAETRRKYRTDMAWLDRWNWTPTAEQQARLDAEVEESKKLIAAYNKKQRQVMLAAASK